MAGEVIPGHDTEIRSRWTQEHLCLLYTCHYETQHLKPNPVTDKETNKLWEWDVAECFIGSDFENIHLYKEFQVSPQGEYVDLDINSRQMGQGNAVAWDSGFLTKARRDDANKVWYGEMRLPFKAIDGKEPAVGRQFRLNFLRCQGTPPNRKLINWQPTKTKTFHTPEAFGLLKLV
jgi:hypothetical protein